jgi:hypothetical protein
VYFGVGGIVLIASSYVLGILRPFFWVSEWNNDLAQALGTRVTIIDLEHSRVSVQPNSIGTSWKADLDLVSFPY